MAGSHVTRDNVNLYKVINEFINELYEFMTSRPCAGVSCDVTLWVPARPPRARLPAIPQLDCLVTVSPCRPPLSPSPAPPPAPEPQPSAAARPITAASRAPGGPLGRETDPD